MVIVDYGQIGPIGPIGPIGLIGPIGSADERTNFYASH